VKLVLREQEEPQLRAEMAEYDGYVSSALLAVEAIRTCSRHEGAYVEDARGWLHDVALLPLDETLRDAAAALGPSFLRSLDALHLATALSIGDDLGVFLTFDRRLAGAAVGHGLPVKHPGFKAL
jgi:predicted nucleic acid-binding protein